MNTQHIIATVALAFAGTSAFASEATQFTDMPSTQSRAEVKAELARALAAGELNGASELYGSFTPKAGSDRSRAEVRAEARQSARNPQLNTLYVGA